MFASRTSDSALKRAFGAMLTRHLPDAGSPVWYVAGPPAMVSGLFDVLAERGVEEPDSRSEEFSRY